MIVSYPLPSRELSPNGRFHWAVVAKHKKSYRQAYYLLTKEAKLPPVSSGRVALDITFYPRSRRRMDIDNLVASLKAGIDGIADALEVDDSRFEYTFRRADDIMGMVKIKFSYTAQGGEAGISSDP